MKDAIKKERAAYVKDRSEDQIKRDKLVGFLSEKTYELFLQTLLDYCRELFRLENKQQVLQHEARQRRLVEPQILPSEKKKLNEKALKLAQAYARIVYEHKSIDTKMAESCHSYMQFKTKIRANERKDEAFYEGLMLFSAKCLRDAFDPSDLMKLEEEVNRLFRSNAFNITERKIQNEERLQKYPQLQDGAGETTE